MLVASNTAESDQGKCITQGAPRRANHRVKGIQLMLLRIIYDASLLWTLWTSCNHDHSRLSGCTNRQMSNSIPIHILLRPLQLQRSQASLSFQLLYLSGRIVSSLSSLLDRRPMFVLVSLLLACLPVFLILF